LKSSLIIHLLLASSSHLSQHAARLYLAQKILEMGNVARAVLLVMSQITGPFYRVYCRISDEALLAATYCVHATGGIVAYGPQRCCVLTGAGLREIRD
jgi:hypothetical protein